MKLRKETEKAINYLARAILGGVVGCEPEEARDSAEQEFYRLLNVHHQNESVAASALYGEAVRYEDM